jgi:hypothetical protein
MQLCFNIYNRLADFGLFVLISYIFDVLESGFKAVASMTYKVHEYMGKF